MIGIINYNAGNIKSVVNAVAYCTDEQILIADHPRDLEDCSKLILPGVGAFGEAMESLDKAGFSTAIPLEVKKGKYLLGICLGMQLLATISQEFGVFSGLDLIGGEILPFRVDLSLYRVPHMGWNTVGITKQDPFFFNIETNMDFYFAHSYYFHCEDESNILAMTNHGMPFVSAIRKENVYGVQFHPEKSQQSGLQLIKNFIGLSG
ncbi:MAG: imidazole glycerol phosphate synthase subunit HisH [Desulfobacteraceae bacterium]|nr:imidazole glycerol phosphate synthase subunit HisH [Desulfobacteraceae bacterium]